MMLKDRVAIVTGASSGMGWAISLLFAKKGAKIVAVARRKERLDKLVVSAKEQGCSVFAVQGDVNFHPLGIKKAMAGIGLNIRTGSPEEIAKTALFLASDDSSLINGTTLVADSGWTAY